MTGAVLLVGVDAAASFADTNCLDNLSLNFAAHEDDDILFMNPAVQRDITTGRCVLTVFVTAGDANRGASYWQAREMGARAAYAQMAGVADEWTRSTVTIAGRPFVHDTLVELPTVSLLFMRLPDGNVSGGGFSDNDFESLQKLWTGAITTITAVDGSASYSKSTLTSTLSTLMSIYQPDVIRTQDCVSRFGDGDHSDHHSVGYFGLAAHKEYVTPHVIIAYRGYTISSLPANLSSSEADAKLTTFLAYAAHDPAVCQTRAACLSSSYGPWFSRQYTTGSELGGRQNVAPLASITSSSENTSTNQQASKAVDGTVAGYPISAANEWATVGGKAGSWINATWGSSHTVARVALYDRPNANDQVTDGTLQFGDGSMVSTGALPNDGSVKVITFAPRSVTSMRFTVTSVSSSTRNVGLAELQAYSTNVAPRAAVTASSQNTATNQQASKAVDGYAVGWPVNATREWATLGGRAGSWLRLVWTTPQTVSRIVLYDRPNTNDQITDGTLVFSDGSSVTVPQLPNTGAGQAITFPARTVTSVQLTVTSVSSTTVNIGLAEIQVE
jgi:LmbE family N-acetylglucosaminyl deacetylase